MTTAELANYIAPFLAPAKRIVDALPNCKGKSGIQAFELRKAERQGMKTLVIEPLQPKPSTRTYYLGTNGRVSQRKHLVGEVIATVRACNTDQARFLFTENRRSLPISVPKPFIGEAVLCKCGWHHAKHSECSVCANWKHIGQHIVAGEAEA